MPSRRPVVLILSQSILAAHVDRMSGSPPRLRHRSRAAAATVDMVAALQTDLQTRDPNARVGTVVSVSPRVQSGRHRSGRRQGHGCNFPSKVGDAFVIMDSADHTIAQTARIFTASTPENGQDIYVLKYTVLAGGRAPSSGDLASHLSTR